MGLAVVYSGPGAGCAGCGTGGHGGTLGYGLQDPGRVVASYNYNHNYYRSDCNHGYYYSSSGGGMAAPWAMVFRIQGAS